MIESLESRVLCSVVTDVLGIDDRSVLGQQAAFFSTAGSTYQPMKKTAPVIGVPDGVYVGVLTSEYFDGIKEPGINGTYSDQSAMYLSMLPGRKRNYGIIHVGTYINVGMGTENLSDIQLSGKKGSTFKLYGSSDNWSGAVASIDVSVKVSISSDGRKVSGTFSSVMHGMMDNDITWAGDFAAKRQKGV